MSLAPGTPIGNYEILAPLGAGGMGEVYRAHDARLGRDVAIKVLPEGFGQDKERLTRFQQEARVLAALSHPNIVQVFEAGEHQGAPYLVMELLEGETLRAVLASGPLSPERTAELGEQMAAGLAAAHERSIVHRDLKPENIYVTRDGVLKILDFGLAKRNVLAEMDCTVPLGPATASGTVLGTLSYMSPEQATGRATDFHSDQFSLGVILYELLSGQRPFAGESAAESLAALVRDEPAPLEELRPEITTGLAAIVMRCLAKEPKDRFASTKDLAKNLSVARMHAYSGGTVTTGVQAVMLLGGRRKMRRRILLGVAVGILLAVAGPLLWRSYSTLGQSSITSLAVLPLQNYSGDAQQDFFVDGMTDALIGDLGQIKALKVISRTSVMHYKGGKKTLPEIAKELGVQGILEGSVLRSGNRVRVSARLMDARQDLQLWSNSYERDLTDVMSLQREVARAVADEIKAALTPQERARLTKVRAVDPEAYDAYLKGVHHWYSLMPGDLDASQRYFELALEKDPNYAKAFAGISLVWAARQQVGYAPSSEAVPKARAAALKALALDETIPEAHYALAVIKTWMDWDWVGAEPEFKRAIELNPNFPDARAYYSHYLMHMGRPVEALPQMKRALELDPFNALFQGLFGVELLYAHRYDEAIAQGRSSLQTAPGNPAGQGVLWWAFQQKGMEDEALAAAKAFYEVVYGAREVVFALDRAHAEGGYRVAMRKAADALAAHSRKANVNPTDVASLYAGAGEVDLAIEWLEKGLAVRDPSMPYMGLPIYDILRADPRFQDLLARVGLPKEPAK